MSNIKNKDSMAYQNKKAYVKNYNKKMQKRIYIAVNTKTEADLLDYLNTKPKQKFIKQLIRDKMREENAGK